MLLTLNKSSPLLLCLAQGLAQITKEVQTLNKREQAHTINIEKLHFK